MTFSYLRAKEIPPIKRQGVGEIHFYGDCRLMEIAAETNPEQGDWWERVRKCQLPRPPSVVVQLLEVIRKDTDLRQSAEIISRDPTLSAEILTIVNSAWFGLRREIKTITHAVTLLGVDAVCSLASAFALRDGLKQFAGNGFDYASYWRRSVLAATAARVLGTTSRMRNQEEVFLASLLQDIGMLVLAASFPEIYGELVAETEGNHVQLRSLERERIGTDHVDMGVWLQETWHLPSIFREAVKGSHDFSQIEAEEDDLRLIRCVALSGSLADIWENPDTAEACSHARTAASTIMELDPVALHPILVSMAKDFREVVDLFRVADSAQNRIHQVLARALEELTPDQAEPE
jgi:HD-like signal output (HDOD) protein